MILKNEAEVALCTDMDTLIAASRELTEDPKVIQGAGVEEELEDRVRMVNAIDARILELESTTP